jgi:DNA-binding MarR family transcriptional regulator
MVDGVVLPALLRGARGAYGIAIQRALSDAGYWDLPRNGPYVIGGMANHGGSASDLIRQLGVTKQAASQLIDTLVVRGYLERSVDPEDRRRLTIDLTDRGRDAAVEIRAAVQDVDSWLADKLTSTELDGLRAGLIALCDVRDELGSAEGVDAVSRPE